MTPLSVSQIVLAFVIIPREELSVACAIIGTPPS